MQEMKNETKAVIRAEILELRREQRRTTLLPDEPDFESKVHDGGPEYGMKLVKELICDLSGLAENGLLHIAMANKKPAPMIKMVFVTKRARTAILQGKEDVYPILHPPHYDLETHLPRMIRNNKNPTTIRLLKQKTQSSLIYSLIYNVEECENDASSYIRFIEADSILSTERFRWVGAGRDKFSIQPWPDLLGLEKGLEALITKPLNDISSIPEVAHLGSKLIEIFNHKDKLESVLTKSRNLLETSLYAPLAMLGIMRQYEYLACENQAEQLANLINSHIDDYAGLGVEMKTIQCDLHAIQSRYPDCLNFGLLEVDLRSVKQELLHNGNQLLKLLLHELVHEYTGLLNYGSEVFSKLLQDLRRVPTTVEELKDLSDYIDSQEDLKKFASVKVMVQKTAKIQQILSDFQQAVDPSQMFRSWYTVLWEEELMKTRSRMVAKLTKVKPLFVEQVVNDAKKLRKVVEDNRRQMEKFAEYEDTTEAVEYAALADEALQTLSQASTRISVLNSREKVLGLSLTFLGDFTSEISAFRKHSLLWNFAKGWVVAWNEWHMKGFRLINPEFVESKYREGLELLIGLEKQFNGLQGPMAVCRRLGKQVVDFQDYVRVISQLRHASIRDRHWDIILKELSIPLKAESVTLNDLVQSDVLLHRKVIDEVCHKALNEYAVEMVVEKTEGEINSFSLEMKKDERFPDLIYLSGLTEYEEITQSLLTTLRFLSSSSHFIPLFKQRIDKATSTLSFNLQVIKDLIELQRKWKALYPVLQLKEVGESIGRETDLIDHVQMFYTKQLGLICASQMLTTTNDLKIKTIIEAIDSLDILQKKVHRVLSDMSASFPRFQLLSDKELVTFLSALSRQQPIPLDLLFPGIAPLHLSDSAITAAFHKDCKLVLDPPVAVKAKGSRLSPDIWLAELETGLKSAFKGEIVRLMGKAEKNEIEWWKDGGDPQVLLVTQMMLFTKGVEKYGEDGREKACQEVAERLRESLSHLTSEIRPLYSSTNQVAAGQYQKPIDTEPKFSKRFRLEKLAIQHISQLHFLAQAIESQSFLPRDYLWKGHFALHPKPTAKTYEIHVSFFDVCRSFGFEWIPLPLGMHVATPITDRCYLNLAAAMRHNTSAVVYAENGTSKTQTMREFAMVYGRLMLEWTVASDSSPHLVIRAITACAGVGAWVCLHEIHKFESHFLNSLSYYLTRLIDTAASTSPIVTIEDAEIRVRPGFACWGTSSKERVKMGIRGQEMFRGVGLVQPDLAAVAEVRLLALGLKQPRQLGRKIARLLTSLADDSASISSSPVCPLRFVNSLRTVHLLISRIAQILDSYPVTDEKYLVSNACRRVLGTSLPRCEEVAFDEFLATIFRSSHNNVVAGTALQRVMERLMELLDAGKVETSDDVMRTIRYLWVSVSDHPRRLILLTGPPGSGKTTYLKAVAHAYSDISSQKFSIPLLSGLVSPNRIQKLIGACYAQAETTGYKFLGEIQRERLSGIDWVVVDTGRADAEVVLALARGEVLIQEKARARVPEGLQFIIETESLSNVSPSVISESCVVHCSEGSIKESEIFRHVLESALSFPVGQLIDLFDSHFKRLNKSAAVSQPIFPLPIRLVVLTLARWLILLLSPGAKPPQRLGFLALETDSLVGQSAPALLDGRENAMLEVAWVISLIGGVGSVLREPREFEAAMRDMCENEPKEFACRLEEYLQQQDIRSMNDVCFNFQTQEWTSWPHFSTGYAPKSYVHPLPASSSLLIPTPSTLRLHSWLTLVTEKEADIAVLGPHQSGKSLIIHEVLRQRMDQTFSAIIPLSILLSTTSETVQHTIHSRMDELSSHYFCALGGRRQFIFLDDMNMDVHGVYDCLRFYRENGGWYYQDGFERIEDVTFCVAHSYSLHKFRTLDTRSLRHFLLLYYDQYSDSDISHIFRVLCPSQIDPTPLSSHFFSSRNEGLANEKAWQHTTLSNYIMALKWVREVDCWPGMWQRYFLDQELVPAAPEHFYVPNIAIQQAPATHFSLFAEDQFPVLLTTFHRMMGECEKKHTDSMKAVHKVILRSGERLARQLYLFCGIVGDLESGQHCVVVTRRELRTARAVTLMAAELVGLPVVDIRIFDMQATLVNTFASFKLGYVPTEVKFDLKHIITRAIQGQRSVCLLTIDDESDLSSPVFHSFMDLLIDVLLGKEIKGMGTIRKSGEFPALYPDQLTQALRERIQKNITLCFLIQTSNFSFSRSDRCGPLEALKHDYRSLFNLCRLVSFDCLPLPPLLASLSDLVKRPSDSDKSLEVTRKLAEALPTAIDDFTVERIAYISKVMQKTTEAKVHKELDILRKALYWCAAIELEGEKAPYLMELQGKIEALRKKLQAARRKQDDPSRLMLAAPGSEASIASERKAFSDLFDKKKERLKKAIGDLSKAEWQPTPPTSPGQYTLIAALQTVVTSDSPPFPFDQESEYAGHCQQFVETFADKCKEIYYQLTTIDYAKVCDLSEFIGRISETDLFSPLGMLILAIEEMRIIAVEQNDRMQRRKSVMLGGPPILEAPQPEIYEMQAEMASLEEEMQQVMVLKPKMARLCSDIKELHQEWAVREASLSLRFDHALGTSLVSATLFVLGLSLASAPRDHIRESVQSFLQSESIPFDPLEAKDTRHPTSSPFLQEGISSCIWIWRLTLPYPLFIDPYCMAPDLILDRGKVVYTLSSAPGFEDVLFDCLAEGKALLIVEPSESIWQLILPLIKWRYDRSVEAARGEDIKSTPVSFRKKLVQIHSDFRLYVSISEPLRQPSIAQLFTVISFEPRDPGSWKTSIFLQMTEEQGANAAQISWKGPKEEILCNLATAPQGTIYNIPTLSVIIKSAMRIEAYEAEMAMRVTSKEEADDPSKLIYVELLAAAIDFSDLLQDLSLDGWTVSSQMYRRLMIQACEEQFQEAGMPTREQLSVVTEPIWYRFLVRLLWGLPRKEQYAVLLLHCLSKKHSKEEVGKIRELIVAGLSRNPAESEEEMGKRLRELIEALPSFPDYFTERSTEFKHFVHRFFYSEKENEGIDVRLQTLLISWLRPDLLPEFLDTLIVDALGKRFAHFSDVDFSLVQKAVPSSAPFVVFYTRIDPLQDIKEAAANLEIGVVHIVPTMKLKDGGLRAESKLRKVLRTISIASKDKRWIVMEGFEDLERIEVDSLFKAFYAALSTEFVHPEFRLWILFEQPPKRLPNWTHFIQQSFRLCINPPKSVLQVVTLAQRQLDPVFNAIVSRKARECYLEHCQVSAQFARKGVKKMTRVNPAVRSNLSRILKGDGETGSPRLLMKAASMLLKNSLTPKEDTSLVGNESDFLKFNLAVGTAGIMMRQKFAGDVCISLAWKHIRNNIEDIISLSSDHPFPDSIWWLSRLYLHLLTPSWSENGYYAALNILKHCLASKNKGMYFCPIDGSGDSNAIEYPLYQISRCKPIEKLIEAIPKWDHLQMAGLQHALFRRLQAVESLRLCRFISRCPALPPCPETLSSLDLLFDSLRASLPYRPLQIERPTPISFESAYEIPTESRSKRFSYYFVPDRFRANDIKSRVMADPVDLKSVLKRLQKTNEAQVEAFIRDIEAVYVRVMAYFNYRIAKLTENDREIVAAIEKDETPTEWRERGPYVLRDETRVRKFVGRLRLPLVDFQGVIGLRDVADPPGLLTALLRSFSFVMQHDFETLHFELAEHTGSLPSNSILLSDLHLFNAVLHSEMLRDSYNEPPFALPVCRCTAVVENKDMEDTHPSPAGMVVHFKPPTRGITSVATEETLTTVGESAFHYPRSELLESKPTQLASSSFGGLNKVILPLFETHSKSWWIVFLSDQPQSHWSKRDARVDLVKQV